MLRIITENDKLEASALNFLTKTDNLFLKGTVEHGVYVQNGSTIADPAFWASDYIPVEAEQLYTRSFVADKKFDWFDSSKDYLGGGQSGATIEAPAGAAYIRICCRYTEFTPDMYMFVFGEQLPPVYKPYYLDVADTLDITSKCNRLMSRFWGKKLAVLGDSNTYGFIPRNNQLTHGTISSYTTTVTGINTAFTSEMEGYPIVCAGETRTIDTVTSPTQLTINTAFNTDKSNQLYTVQYNNYPGRLNSYAYWLGQILNMTVYNYGISGSFLGLLNGNDYNAMETRYDSMIDDADLDGWYQRHTRGRLYRHAAWNHGRPCAIYLVWSATPLNSGTYC